MFVKIIKYLAMVTVLIFSIYTPVIAVPAAGVVEAINQPDGATVRARMQGDEHRHWVETEDGYTIDKKNDGFWHYVESFSKASGKDKVSAILSGIRADKKPPSHLKKHIAPPEENQVLNPQPTSGTMGSMAVSGAAFTGVCGSNPSALKTTPSGKVLFILGQYGNRLGITTEQHWSDFLSAKIATYFRSVSLSQVNLTPAAESFGTANNGVVGWITIGPTYPTQWSAASAVSAADPYVNFAAFDTNLDGAIGSEELAIVLVVAGYEKAYSADTPSIWAHAGTIAGLQLDGVNVGSGSVTAVSLNTCGYAALGELQGSHPATMGVAIHELGHSLFGLPDLYLIPGMNSYDVMSGGAWGTSPTDIYMGETPVAPSAWTKYTLGWVDAAETTGATSVVAFGDATATRANTVRRVSTPMTNEYFLIENRQPISYDRGLNSASSNWGGVAIWHVDNNVNAAYSSSPLRMLDLEEANRIDGGSIDSVLWRLGHPLPGYTNAFDGSSTPNSSTSSGLPTPVAVNNFSASSLNMSATINNTTPLPTGQASQVGPTGTIATATPTFSWKAESGASHYYVTVQPSGSTQTDFQKMYTAAEAVCAGGTGSCAVTPTYCLYNAPWEWTIFTWANNGVNTTKGTMPFTVNATAATAATMVSPGAGVNISPSSVTFTWSGVGCPAQHVLYVGSTFGGGDIANLWYSGNTTSATLSSLPVGTVFVRLWTNIGNMTAPNWQFRDYTYNVTANQPPTANAGPSVNVNEGKIATLAGSGTDPDGTIVSYEWTQIVYSGDPLVSLSGANTAMATFTAPLVNTTSVMLEFQLKVTDNSGATATALTWVYVKNLAPDLIVSALTASVITGSKPLSVKDRITNQGNAAAGSFVVAYYLSTDDQLNTLTDIKAACTRTISSLAANASNPLSATLESKCKFPTTAQSGTLYYVFAVVDSANTIAESNELNNSRITTQVKAP